MWKKILIAITAAHLLSGLVDSQVFVDKALASKSLVDNRSLSSAKLSPNQFQQEFLTAKTWGYGNSLPILFPVMAYALPAEAVIDRRFPFSQDYNPGPVRWRKPKKFLGSRRARRPYLHRVFCLNLKKGAQTC